MKKDTTDWIHWPIYRIAELGLMYRAESPEHFLEYGVPSWKKELVRRELVRRRLEMILDGVRIPGPIPMPQVKVEGVEDGAPVLRINGERYRVEVLPPDYFSLVGQYREALATPEGEALHQELVRMLEAGHPRVRRSNRSGLPIVLHEDGTPLKIYRMGPVLEIKRGPRFELEGEEHYETEAYLPIWDPPGARKVLAFLR